MSEQDQRDDLIGKTLGQYEILEEVGRGGMATVFKARQLSMNRIVAVKVLPRHFLHDPGFFERFEREVDVISHLEHPHILPIYDYGKAENTPYIAMRYLGGGSMAQLIRRGPVPVEQLDRPFGQVAQALDHAHRQGIIHRDLKPGNVMLDEEGNAYLSDFGIARIMGSNLTGSMIIGTPAYMSPEQANGFSLDARSDIYSLGVVLFELITGREPYQAETPMALLLKHINEPMPPLSDFRADVPLAVEQVIAKATAKDPNQRYSSAGQMAHDFSEALRDPRRSTRAPMPMTDDAPTIMPDTGSGLRGGARPTPFPGTPAPTNPPRTPYPTGPATPYPPPQPVTPVSGAYQQTPYGQTPYPGTPPPGTPYPGTMPPPQAAPSRMPLIIGGILVLAVLVLIGVVAVPKLTSGGEIPVTRVAETIPPATPFASAQVVSTDHYLISIPKAWIPPQGFLDQSSSGVIVHMWQASDESAYAALSLKTADVQSADSYKAAVADYTQQYYKTQRAKDLTLIDEATAPDGTVRQSYRLGQETQTPYSPGQVDVFFLRRSPYLAILELYSADSTGNTLVQTFQQILDSVDIKTS
jgi:serine/threonine protein kinase